MPFLMASLTISMERSILLCRYSFIRVLTAESPSRFLLKRLSVACRSTLASSQGSCLPRHEARSQVGSVSSRPYGIGRVLWNQGCSCEGRVYRTKSYVFYLRNSNYEFKERKDVMFNRSVLSYPTNISQHCIIMSKSRKKVHWDYFPMGFRRRW